MNWIINLFYMFCFTTMTGGILTVVWRLIGAALEKAGCLNISYRLMQWIIPFWLIPIVYIFLWSIDSYSSRWGGDLLWGTPALYRIAEIVLWPWFTGIVIIVMRYLYEMVKLFRIRQTAFPCNTEMNRILNSMRIRTGVKDEVLLRQSYLLKSPHLTGFIRPMIILPIENYSAEELDLIFEHELTHVRHKDILVKNLGMLIRAVHFMNPLAWWYCAMLNRWSEFACDYDVCAARQEVKHYYTVLLSMAIDIGKCDLMVSRIVEEKKLLLERMEHVSKSYRKINKHKGVTAVLIAAIVAVSGSSLCFVSARAADALQ